MRRKKIDKNKKEMHNASTQGDVVFEEEGETATDTIKKLREKLKQCKTEREEYLDGWQRARADLVNARKNEDSKQQSVVKYANEGLITELIEVLDSFELAFANKEAWERIDKNWRIGVEHIYNQLLKTLRNSGLETIDDLGKKFDPSRHESIESVLVVEKLKDNTVAEVLSRGYTLNSKVIRPAKIKVALFKN